MSKYDVEKTHYDFVLDFCNVVFINFHDFKLIKD